MKIQITKDPVYLILGTIFTVSVLLIAIIAFPMVMAKFSDKPDTIEGIISSCKDLDLKNSSECVLGITKDFYKYNIDNVGRTLSFPELRDEGGVCSSWSEYYSEIGKNLGFSTRDIIVPIDDYSVHEFSVWSSETGYCILDQTKLMCVGLQ